MKVSCHIRVLLSAFLLTGTLFLTGCASTGEPENESSRPWNQPRGWESGVPGMLQNNGRY